MSTINIGGQPVEGARIDELDQTVLHSRDHVVPAMHDGITVKLSVAQVLSLLSREDLLGELFAEDLTYDPHTIGALVAETAQDAIDEIATAYVSTRDQSFSPADKAQARANMDLSYADEAAKGQFRANIGAGTSNWNWIINGDFSVNQRGAASKSQSVGVYGYDRWRGHANGLEQIIEGLPAGTYTLTFGGGGTGSVDGQPAKASPATFTVAIGGNISVVVPATATRVSLVQGDATAEADPFSPRHPQQELALCQRYYEVVGGSLAGVTGGTYQTLVLPFRVVKRASSTVTRIGDYSSSNEAGTLLTTSFDFPGGLPGSLYGITLYRDDWGSAVNNIIGGIYAADAEF